MSDSLLKFKDKITGKFVTLDSGSLIWSDKLFYLPNIPGTLAIQPDLDRAFLEFNSYINRNASNIVTPSITFPITETTNFYGTVEATSYATAIGYIGKHLSSDWEFATDDKFVNIVITSTYDTINLTTFTFNPTLFSTVHYCRVRYRTDDFVSEWSTVISFESKSTFIKAPIISTSENVNRARLTPSFTSSAMEVVNGTDIHSSTDWQIAKDASFSEMIIDDKLDTVNLLSYLVTNNLDLDTTYYIRAKYNGIRFKSEWSNILAIKTTSKTANPILTGPLSANEQDIVPITIGNYDSTYKYTIMSTLGEVSRTDNIINLKLPIIGGNVNVTVSVIAAEIAVNAPESDIVTHVITVNDLGVISDQALVYNSTNIGSTFDSTLIDISKGTLVSKSDISILDKTHQSTASKLYINNELIDLEVGDTLVGDNTEYIKVKTISNDGITETTDYLINISMGASHSAGINKDGYLCVVGYNAYGQLGLGDNTDRYSWVNTGIKVKSVSCGYHHTAIIKLDGTMWTTGRNTEGQLGINSTIGSNVFITTGLQGKSIVCGGYHTIVLGLDKYVYTVGRNSYGELGLNGKSNRYTFTNTGKQAKAVYAGVHNTGIIGLDDTLYVCGYNQNSQLGFGDIIDRVSLDSTNIKAKKVAFTLYGMIILKTDNSIWVCGNNADGSLGLGSTPEVTVLTSVNMTGTDIAASENTSYIVKDNTLYGTGTNGYGELGLGTTAVVKTYTSIKTGIVKVVGGYRSMLAIDSNNLVYGCGEDTRGLLGFGSVTATRTSLVLSAIELKPIVKDTFYTNYYVVPETNMSKVPTTLKMLSNTTKSLPITQDIGDTDFRGLDNITYKENSINIIDSKNTSTINELYVDNYLANVKAGDYLITNTSEIVTVSEVVPVGAKTFKTVKKVAVGAGYSLLIDGDDYLWVIGRNNTGQLGLGHYIDVKTWYNTGIQVTQISAGYAHSIIVKKDDNTVYTTGFNNRGQLGNGTLISSNTWISLSVVNPISIGALWEGTAILKEDNTIWYTGNLSITTTTVLTNLNFSAKEIAYGDYNIYALTTDNKLYGIGANGFGQLANGTNTSSATFIIMAENVTKLVASTYHIFIKKTDNLWYCAGRNTEGQLGLGDFTNRTSFVAAGIAAVDLYTGNHSTLYVDAAGDMYGTGYNLYNQLGLGYNGSLVNWTKMKINSIKAFEGTTLARVILNNGKMLLSGLTLYSTTPIATTPIAELKSTPSTCEFVESEFSKDYYPTYKIIPSTTLANAPTAIYPLSNIEFNNVKAEYASASYSAGTVTATLQPIEFDSSRTIVTHVEVPDTNSGTEIKATIKKLAN